MKAKLTALAFLFVTGLFAQSAGPLSPQSATYSFAGCLSCAGSEWNNPVNVNQPDSNFAEAFLTSPPQCFQSACYFSRNLYAYNFGFAIPANATILGVKADVLRKSSGMGLIADSAVWLKTYNPVGIPKAYPSSWTSTATYVSYGDSLNLWGYTLTPDTINNSLFGLAVCILNKVPVPTITTSAMIDHIQITVWYSTGMGIKSQTRTPGGLAVGYNELSRSIDICKGEKQIDKLDIYDVMGRRLHSFDLHPYSSNQVMHIPVELPTGNYIWKSDNGGSGKLSIVIN